MGDCLVTGRVAQHVAKWSMLGRVTGWVGGRWVGDGWHGCWRLRRRMARWLWVGGRQWWRWVVTTLLGWKLDSQSGLATGGRLGSWVVGGRASGWLTEFSVMARRGLPKWGAPSDASSLQAARL